MDQCQHLFLLRASMTYALDRLLVPLRRMDGYMKEIR